MEPNNIENQIKEKLNTREIQPSAQAWDRLDAMLSVAEEKKTKRSAFLSLRFIGIAASVLVFITVGAYFYNQEKTTTKPMESVVVNETSKDTLNNNSALDKTKINEAITPIQKQQPLVQIENNLVKSQESKNNATSTNQNEVSINNQKVTANQKTTANQKQDVIVAENSKKEEVISPKNNEVNLNLSEQPKQTAVALNENTVKKELPTITKVKVDANSLLSQVDGELELTFREKVLKKVTKNYKEVKVALANRNQKQ
jgi:ABC-type lipoprotein release transport system permease subunit